MMSFTGVSSLDASVSAGALDWALAALPPGLRELVEPSAAGQAADGG
jgi:hypothetical protein